MQLRYVLVDVFADRPLAGNPLAVFPDASGLKDETLQLVAREMDHAATAFLFKAETPGADFRLRIFSREREIPFAGHPALGAHFVFATEAGRTDEAMAYLSEVLVIAQPAVLDGGCGLAIQVIVHALNEEVAHGEDGDTADDSQKYGQNE